MDCLLRGDLRTLWLRDLRRHVAAEARGASPASCFGQHLGDRSDFVGGLVVDARPNAAQPSGLQSREEAQRAVSGLGEAPGVADCLAIAVIVYADG